MAQSLTGIVEGNEVPGSGDLFFALKIGYFGTWEASAQGTGGSTAVPLDAVVGQDLAFDSYDPTLVPGAGPFRALRWAQEAVNRETPTGLSAVKDTPNSQSGQDEWAWSRVGRRGRFRGSQTIKRQLWTVLGGRQTMVVEDGPYDVIFRWAADPKPGHAGELAWTEWDPATGTYFITLASWLGDPSMPPPYSAERFYKEAVWHELGHVICGLAMESRGVEWVKAQLQRCFRGRSWNTGPWQTRVLEATCETFKDWFYPWRVFDNRTALRLPANQWERFGDVMVQSVFVPGGPLAHEMGSVATDLIEKWGAEVDHWPQPRPRFDHQQRWKVPYDMPRRSGTLRGGGASVAEVGWQWGAKSFPADPRTPPPPGTVVVFEVEWDDPLGHAPDSDRSQFEDIAAAVETIKPDDVPRGVMVMDTGGPEEEIGGIDHGGPASWGIVWLVADSPTDDYTAVLPPELEDDTWEEQAWNSPGTTKRRYEPVYFDLRRAGKWSMAFVVPEHGGELAWNMRWSQPGFSNQSFVDVTILEGYPIRTRHHGAQWTVYPTPKPLLPIVFPQGEIQVGKARPAFVPAPELVVGSPSP